MTGNCLYAFCLLPLVACADGGGAAGALSTVIDTVGDTIVARTRGAVPDEALRVFTVEWRAGEGDDPATSFASIASIGVGPDGSVLVWDPRGRALRLYSPDGALLGPVGAVGSGPGEYDRVNGVAIRPDGKLLVWDSGNSRINVYAADGTFETSWMLPVRGYGTSNALVADDSGRAWLAISVWPPDGSGSRSAWLRLTTSGEVLDTVLAPRDVGEDGDLTARRGGASATYSRPFGRSVVAAVHAPGTVLWGMNRTYAINTHTGGHPLRIEREWVPVATTLQERDQAKEGVVSGLRMTDPSWQWTGPPVATDKPPYWALRSGLDGRIWVSLSTPSEEFAYDMRNPDGTTQARTAFRAIDQRWDVFEPDGRYVGRVVAPRTLTPMVFRGDQAWGVSRDADDVPTLVRLRVTPALGER